MFCLGECGLGLFDWKCLNVFTSVNGQTACWGFLLWSLYHIVETHRHSTMLRRLKLLLCSWCETRNAWSFPLSLCWQHLPCIHCVPSLLTSVPQLGSSCRIPSRACPGRFAFLWARCFRIINRLYLQIKVSMWTLCCRMVTNARRICIFHSILYYLQTHTRASTHTDRQIFKKAQEIKVHVL